MNSGLRQPRTGVVDGAGGGTAAREEDAGESDAGAAWDALGAGAGEDVGRGTVAGAATPPTGPSPQPATARKGIANTPASILRRIFPPATRIRQNEAEP